MALDGSSDSFVDAVCEGAEADPWHRDATLPVPVRFETEAGTIAAEMRDPPHPPASERGTVVPVGPRKPERTPLVTVSIGPDGKPRVEVEGGSARVRIFDA